MRVPVRWLSDYVDLECEAAAVARLADRLTLAGLEVEGLETVDPVSGVFVARVTTCVPHPDSDHLSLCSVDVGGETVDVVCGAANVRAGILVPLARVGAVLPGGFRIEKRKVRGQTSHGMICSKQELGLEDRSDGIWILDEELRLTLGTDLASLLEFDDWVFDIKVTSNRPDCASVYGVAREVAALLDRPLRALDASLDEAPARADAAVRIAVESAVDAPRYAARLLESVRIGPSPLRLQHRLLKAGMRPIANLVDATNLAMLELGHPLHPFDADRLSGAIGVRRARRGESFRTLDGIDRELDERALLITDNDRPIALAGVMGGEQSEIQSTTTRVLLEVAVFDHEVIRQSARSVGLRSEASQRFERGLSPEGVPLAAARAAQWIVSLCGGRVRTGLADAYPKQQTSRTVRLRPGRAAALLGIDVDAERSAALLRRLGIDARLEGEDVVAPIPAFRSDLEREADLIEEVGRVHGYDHLVAASPRAVTRVGRKNATERGKDRVRDTLVALGMDEAVTDGFDKHSWREALGESDQDLVSVRNPMAATQAFLRGSLLPGLLGAVETNLHRGVDGGMLFEVGRVFSISLGERDLVAGALFGRTGRALAGKERVSFDLARGIVDRAFESLRLDNVSITATNAVRCLHPGRSAVFARSGEALGVLGEIHPDLLERFAVPTAVVLFEFALTPLLSEWEKPVRSLPLPQHPAAKRDLSLSVPSSIEEARVRAALLAEAEVESILLYDVYAGEQVGAGRKSLTYEVTLRGADRTLQDADIAGVVDRVARRLAEFDVNVRAA